MKIALVGKARTGKDAIGKLLIDNYGFKRFAFAEGITEIINTYFPESFEKGKPRGHYLHIGQTLRELNPNVWVNYTKRNIDKYLRENENGRIVITDCRQLNESNFLKDHGFVIVKVVAPVQTRLERMESLGDNFTIDDLEHDTEKQVDLIIPDLIIENDGSIEQLIRKVNTIIKLLKIEGESIGED